MKLLRMEREGAGGFLKKYRLIYENREGREKAYEIVSHRELSDASELGAGLSGVSILAVREGRLLLLREFRLGVNRPIYNLCAGMLETGESVSDCIRRELDEETGLRLTKIHTLLPPAFAAVSISDIRNQLAIVTVEGEIAGHASANEEIEAAFYTPWEVRELLRTAEFSSRAQLAAYFFLLWEESGENALPVLGSELGNPDD